MRGLTLSFGPTKTHGPIFVDLKEKHQNFFFPFSLSLRSLSLFSVYSLPFDLPFSFYPFFYTWFTFHHVSISHSGSCLEIVYFFSVQFLLNELSSSHFLISEIFVKISSLKSLTTYHLENCKNIPIVSEFDETFLGHWIS